MGSQDLGVVGGHGKHGLPTQALPHIQTSAVASDWQPAGQSTWEGTHLLHDQRVRFALAAARSHFSPTAAAAFVKSAIRNGRLELF